MFLNFDIIELGKGVFMQEKNKMLNGFWYDPVDKALTAERFVCKNLCFVWQKEGFLWTLQNY